MTVRQQARHDKVCEERQEAWVLKRTRLRETKEAHEKEAREEAEARQMQVWHQSLASMAGTALLTPVECRQTLVAALTQQGFTVASRLATVFAMDSR